MTSIATLGPQGSHAAQAARQFDQQAEIKLFPNIAAVFSALVHKETDYALVPVYNTRVGEIKEFSRLMEKMPEGSWVANVVLPIHLSLGSLDDKAELKLLLGRSQDLRQCEEYISSNLPNSSLMAVQDIDQTIEKIKQADSTDSGIITTEEILSANNLAIRAREIAPHNRTRFAILGHKPTSPTGYDATAIITTPLKDRVGILYDMLGEFSRRGINLLDMHSETDIKSQKLQFYIEMEGHIEEPGIKEALQRIEQQIIQEPGSVRVLGSYPRVDMRVKRIKKIGFIGSGEMSQWFAKRLENEGYETIITGRSSKIRPEDMIQQVDVVVVCVPISATAETVKQYAGKLTDKQALILLAGEAESVLDQALSQTSAGVEVMLVHNLWGPKAATMKDKNVSVVRTQRSGALCSEFETFLYKHGANINLDTPGQHDLMMGVSQKLPTAISVALAMTLKQNNIAPAEIGSYSTLTSLYGILSMARVHAQNARTYAEIMAAQGEGRKIVRNFAENLLAVLDMVDAEDIGKLCDLIDSNRQYLTEDFLKDRMQQALAVDETLGRVIRK